MFEYKGNIHIHSRYSDGGGSIEEIATYASQTGLDFIVITDHSSLEGLEQGEEGYHANVLVLIGMEVNEEFNHYLALGIKEVVANNTNNPQQVINEVNRQKGIGVIAHPFEKGSPCFQDGRTFEWKDWNVSGFQGIEIWNYLSQYRDAFTSILKGIYLLLNPVAGLSPPCFRALRKIDQLQLDGEKVFAYGGSDAHGIKNRVGRWKFIISPYELCFRIVNMHVLCSQKLTGELRTDKEIIYQALRNGHSWIACDYYWESDGFRFELRHGSESWPIGSEVKYRSGLYIAVKTPAKAKVILMSNGYPMKVSQGKQHFFNRIEPGIYRIEAYLKDKCRFRPWIYTNSIWVTDKVTIKTSYFHSSCKA